MKITAGISALLFILSCGFFTSLPGLDTSAHARTQAGQNMKTGSATGPRVVDKASDITGREVVNEEGEHLGYSKDLIIGKDGSIKYLIILRGSAFGVVGPLIPVPWPMVELQAYDKPLLIRIEQKVIRDAPGYTLDKWPAAFSPGDVKQINEYYSKYLPK